MINQFLKIAGVKSQNEFYKKYPSEEAFFNAHPEAKHLQKMAYGGGMYAYPDGGSYNPASVNYGPGLPVFETGVALPEAMYGLGMAEGGQMPQWLAERRFKAAGKEHLMSKYGYDDGGLVKGGEYDMSEEQIQDLINKGYKIEYI